jgi:putative PIN family toxin of toxin-antitoxin system
MLRLVLDTNVLVAAMRSPSGASSRLVVAALDGEVSMLANVALFAEYEAVMTRKEHILAARTTRARVARVLDDLASVIRPVEKSFSWRPQLSDPDDEMVLEAAINGDADVVVTFEVRTFRAAAQRFGIEVMTPRSVCARLDA